jgi:hypothetical protein
LIEIAIARDARKGICLSLSSLLQPRGQGITFFPIHIDAENRLPVHMVNKASFITSSPHHVFLNFFSSPLFLSHVLICNWIAARSSAPAISTIKSNPSLIACSK